MRCCLNRVFDATAGVSMLAAKLHGAFNFNFQQLYGHISSLLCIPLELMLSLLMPGPGLTIS